MTGNRARHYIIGRFGKRNDDVIRIELKNVNPNLVLAIQEAKSRGLRVFGIVGRDGGYTKQAGGVVMVIPAVSEPRITPHTEAFHTVVWHCPASYPELQTKATKW